MKTIKLKGDNNNVSNRSEHTGSNELPRRYKLIHFKGEDYSIVKGVGIRPPEEGKDPDIIRIEFGIFSPKGDSIPSTKSIRNRDLIEYMTTHCGMIVSKESTIIAVKFENVHQLTAMFSNQDFEIEVIEFKTI